MPKHSASQRTARRGLAATGVLSLAFAGGAFVVSGSGSASAASATVKYSCTLTNFGGQPYADPWSVDMNIDVPSTVAPGATIPSPKISAVVTTGEDAADQLRSFGVKSLSGTGVANYTVGGQARTVNLAIPSSDVPASGVVTTNASGVGQDETAPSTPGVVPVKVGDFTSSLTFDSGFVANIACTPVSGANTTVANITVADPAPTTTPTTPAPTTSTSTTPTPTTPTPTTSTTTPAPTTSSPTTPAPTKTTPTTTPATTKPTTPSAPATGSTSSSTSAAVPGAGSTQPPVAGPKIQTDLVTHHSGTNVLGLGLTAAGITSLGGALALGRRRKA